MDITAEHITMAKGIAGRYTVRYNAYRYKEDLEGAAMLGLVEAVSRINNDQVKHDNHIGYICVVIQNHIRKEMRKNHTITPPERNPTPIGCGHPTKKLEIACHDFSIEIHDLMEELEIAMEGDKLLQTIVNLRIEGLTDQGIADILGVSRLAVQRARKQLWRKINVE